MDGHSLARLKELARTQVSSYCDGPLEGVVVRCEEDGWLNARAKLVNPAFTQNIVGHWRKGNIQWNNLDPARFTKIGAE